MRASRTIESKSEAERILEKLNEEIQLRQRKMRSNTHEIFLLQQAAQRRHLANNGLEDELVKFEALREEARAKVAEEHSAWLKRQRENPPPRIQITEFTETPAENAAAA